MRAPFLFDERLQMVGLFDALVAIVASLMIRQYVHGLFGVDDTDSVLARDHHEPALHMRVRHAVVVLVEAHVRRLPYADLEPLLGWKLVARQLDHLRPFLEKGFLDGPGLRVGYATVSGDLDAPGASLVIQIVERGEGARGEEVLAHVPDGSLDPTFLVRTIGGARPRLESVVARECKKRRMKPHRVALPLEHRALEVVVQNHPRHGAEEAECLHVSA